MQTTFQVELGSGFKFAVEQDVKTLGDFRKLLKKADAKIAAACKVLPELNEEKLERARVAAVGTKATTAAAS